MKFNLSMYTSVRQMYYQALIYIKSLHIIFLSKGFDVVFVPICLLLVLLIKPSFIRSAVLRGNANKTRKETSYSDQTRDLFNILPTKLNTLLSPLIYLLQGTQKKFRMLSVQPGLRGGNVLLVGRKMATFQSFFFSPGNRW